MRLRVDPIKCVGHGLCAELLPELIGLDPWGYPVLDHPEVPRDLVAHAKRAVAGCPTLALLSSAAGTAPGRVGTAPGRAGTAPTQASTGRASVVADFPNVRNGRRNAG
jgi:ferredoxin